MLRYGLIGMLALTRLRLVPVCLCWLAAFGLLASTSSQAEEMSGAQRRGAEEFLAAIAGGGATAAVYAIHPTELDELRARLLTVLRDEAKVGDSTIRGRLFGAGMPLTDIERLTSPNFYTTIAGRLVMSGRPYQRVKEVSVTPGQKGYVYALVRGIQPQDHGDIEVVELVKLRAYGKDWKATIPEELSAQIEDLIQGRRGAGGRPGRAALGGGGLTTGGGGSQTTAAAAADPTPREITELLTAAEKSLTDNKCDEYYKDRMSRNFRRVTSKQALEALIGSCNRSASTREMLLSTLRIVKGLSPKYEYDGQRAVYDLSGQGLPFQRFVLEKVDKRWYIAE